MQKFFTVLTFIVVFSLSALSAKRLPLEDPTRFWDGENYAEYVDAYVKQQNPELELTFDISDLWAFKNRNKEQLRVQLSEVWGIAAFVFKPTNLKKLFQRDSAYSLELKQKIKSIFPDKLLTVLANLETGREIELSPQSPEIVDHLRQWITTQKDNSVLPHEIMNQAIVLSQGRILLAWAAVWNMARQNWEASSTRNYGLLTKKLFSLTGERHLWQGGMHFAMLPEENRRQVNLNELAGHDINGDEEDIIVSENMVPSVTKRGDEFSYFYHRIGVELFAMTVATIYDNHRVGKWMGKMGAFGEFFSFTKTAGREGARRKRLLNDLEAGTSGAEIYRRLIRDSNENPKILEKGGAHYLFSRPWIYGKSYQLGRGTEPQYFNLTDDPELMQDFAGETELYAHFYHATRIDVLPLDPVILTSTGMSEQIHRGLVRYMNTEMKNKALNQVIEDWLKGVRPPFSLFHIDYSPSRAMNMHFVDQAFDNYSYEEAERRLRRQVQRVVVEINKRKACAHLLSAS